MTATLPRLPTDFNRRLETTVPGTLTYYVGSEDAWYLDGYDLHEGMAALFEEEGELQYRGVLHRRHTEPGEHDWVAVVDAASLVYHLRVPAGAFMLPHQGQLTLGVEGTREGDALMRFHHDQESIVLIDPLHAVDATIRVAIWDGKQVWVAEPDWASYRPRAARRSNEILVLRQGAQLGADAGRTAQQRAASLPVAALDITAPDVKQDVDAHFLRLITTTPYTITSSRHLYERFVAAFQQGYAEAIGR